MSVTLHCTVGSKSHMEVKLELYVDQAPVACENFLAHCAMGTYNGTRFHRLIKGFIVQGGDPTNTGTGGQSIWGEPFKDEISSSLVHDARGVVSMANSGPDTNACQFFITLGAHEHLDGLYTIFGHVIHGMDVLEDMEAIAVNDADQPLKPITIDSVTIHANPIADADAEAEGE